MYPVVTVGVVEANITVDEGAGVVNVTVTLTEEVILGRPIVLDIGAAGISATGGLRKWLTLYTLHC